MPIYTHILSKYPNPVFIETGSYRGAGIGIALQCGFESIWSVELDPARANAVQQRYQAESRVHVGVGDSAEWLNVLLPTIHQPATFWLDAHPCHNGLTFETCPLERELIAILNHFKSRATILIDDMSAFDPALITRMKELILMLSPNYKFIRENNGKRGLPDDILVATLGHTPQLATTR